MSELSSNLTIREMGVRARAAARVLRSLSTARKVAALHAIAA